MMEGAGDQEAVVRKPVQLASPSFGELLRRYRTAAGFSQEFLADGACVSVESVSALERGVRRAPHRETISMLAKALALDDAREAELHAAANRARARVRVRDDAPLRALPPALPAQTTSLIGREHEIAAVTGLVAKNRLVTITGSGGIGKTRVAVEVARRATERWEDIRFIDLSPLTDGAFVANAIVPNVAGDADGSAAALASALRLSKLLLVLDSCEHVIVSVAHLVSAVVTSCPQVTFLCTSRERLAVTGEAVYRLPPLEATAAIELFVQRASAVDRAIPFNDAAIEVVAEICRRLDGIPLAIKLAAVRVATLGLEPLRQRLRDGLSIAGEVRNLPARQRTVNATIAWSYDLLSEPERLLLTRLAIFAGGFTLAAAEAVCAGDGIQLHVLADLLSSLVDKSLVNVTRGERTTRYSMLNSVRSFALNRLSMAGQVGHLAQRHAEWVAAFADWASAIRPQLPEARMYAQAGPELENARTALTWALATTSEDRTVLAGRIVGGLRMLWVPYGELAEGARWALTVLERLDEDRYPAIAVLLHRLLLQALPADESLAWSARAVRLCERIGDEMGLALLQIGLSREYRRRSRLEEADAADARGAELFRRHEAPPSQIYLAFLHEHLWLRLEQGRHEEALAALTEAIAITRSIGDHDSVRWAINRAEFEFTMGRFTIAVQIVDEIAESVTLPGADQAFLAGGVYASIASYRASNGELHEACIAARESLLLTIGGHRPAGCEPIAVMAFIAASRNDHPLAARLLGAIETLEGARIIGPLESMTKGGGGAVRQLLIAALNEHVPPSELKTLKSLGASYSWDAAVHEALKIEAP